MNKDEQLMEFLCDLGVDTAMVKKFGVCERVGLKIFTGQRTGLASVFLVSAIPS